MKKQSDSSTQEMRLDKWLWCSRFYKTRSIAVDAIKSGKIRVNGDRPKPARNIHVGDSLLIRKDAFKYEIEILALAKSRLPAAKAIELYQESDESLNQRELVREQIKAESALFPRTIGRPTKRDRRDLMKFKKSPTSDEH